MQIYQFLAYSPKKSYFAYHRHHRQTAPMLLSIIIVNYNVKYFLEQCLCSLEKSVRTAGLSYGGSIPQLPGLGSAGPAGVRGGDAEIFVVDNHSSDGSMQWLIPRFPSVQFIANPDNRGFARANNQALEKASGKYVLFLNPDTILAEDSIATVLGFMESAPAAGAAGVRMVDGGGRFLKESRRGFPSPWVAFCKLTGLASLFPRSSFFAKYYLGHLPASADHPAPVLSGAFMLVRRQALEVTGGFDERFFLYAEDIDLSYRIEKAGYNNFYIAGTTILHFKGESTRKDARYIKLFYKAMSQFRRKHFRGGLPSAFNFLMEAAIWVRAGLSAVASFFRQKEQKENADGGWGGGASGRERSDPSGGTGNEDIWAGSAWRGIPGSAPVDPVYIGGDPVNARRLRELLAAEGWQVVPDPAGADERILCEGEGFSFSNIIEAIQDSRGEAIYMIHAAASCSAVGSRSKDGRGETLFFPPKA
jgi:N-acetylglucosaminyl-diphospho-decaprenol L-rhamnosyltransferase